MQDNRYGFEIYYFHDNTFSILYGTNRAKTLDEISSNKLDWPSLQNKLSQITTRNGMPSDLLIMHMGRYNLPVIPPETIQMITDYCTSLGQRPTTHDKISVKCICLDRTGRIITPGDSRLIVTVEQTVTPRDPLSSFMQLTTIVDHFKKTGVFNQLDQALH